MPLPDGFNEFEFLQDIMRKWQNRIVREEFQDLGSEDWDPDITISRGALRHACTHKDTDTAEMMQMRNDLFYIIYRKAQDFQTPVFGILKDRFDADVRYFPVIKLYFYSGYIDDEDNDSRKEGEIGFRYKDSLEEASDRAKLQQLGRKIRTLFGQGKGYMWQKGKNKYTYYNRSLGYDFSVLSDTEANAKELMARVMDIQGDTPNWELFASHIWDRPLVRYSPNPGTRKVLGKTRKKPQRRPHVKVYFRYATCLIHGEPRAITLYDHTGVRGDILAS